MKTYLVTGGAGFIGSNFILYMIKKYGNGIRIINIDSLTYAGNLKNLESVLESDNYKFFKHDICNYNEIKVIFKKYNIDYVVNFAAESHVDRSIENPEIFAQTNILGTLNLLNISKEIWEISCGVYKAGVKFLQVSTDEVYGSLGDTGYFLEETPIDPHSPYSASKASADLFVKAYSDTYKLPINITRCSNNYGPYQFPEKLIPLIINNVLNKKHIPIYGDGLQIRDWLYVDDHCRAIDMVINKGDLSEVYNIGGHNEKTNIYIVKTVIDYMKSRYNIVYDDNLIKYVEDRKGHDRRYGIDPYKIKKDIGWIPEIMFDKGIETTIDWYMQNKQWISEVTSGGYQDYYKNI